MSFCKLIIGRPSYNSTVRSYSADIIAYVYGGLSSTTVTWSACKNWIQWNKGYYAVQGHSRSLMSVPTKSPFPVNTNW